MNGIISLLIGCAVGSVATAAIAVTLSNYHHYQRRMWESFGNLKKGQEELQAKIRDMEQEQEGWRRDMENALMDIDRYPLPSTEKQRTAPAKNRADHKFSTPGGEIHL